MNTSESATPGDSAGVYTIQEWCHAARVSQGSYFKAEREGRGPYKSNMGRRTLITETPLAYYQRMRQSTVPA